MTVAEHRERVGKEFQQAQEQAQRFGQQATQWAQRVLYLQGQLDLLQQLDPEAPAPQPVETPRKPTEHDIMTPPEVAARMVPSRAERRRAAKGNGRVVSPPA